MKKNISHISFLLLIAVMMMVAPMNVCAQKKPMKPQKTVAQQLSYNDKRKFDCFFLEAIRQQEAGKYDAAFDLLQHCLKINPNAPEAYFTIAKYYMELNKDSLGINCYKKAAELMPNNDTYLEKMAQCYINEEKYNDAIDAYQKLYANNPDRTDVLEILIQLYKQNKNYDKMLECLNKIETIEGANEETTLAKMQIMSLQGNDKGAYDELNALCEKHPYDMSYRVMRGNWLMGKNKTKEAYNEYVKVLKEDPDNISAQMSLLDYYRSENQDSLADKMLKSLLFSEKTPSDNKFMLMRQVISDSESKDGDSTMVLNLFKKLLEGKQENGDMADLQVAYMTTKKMPIDTIKVALQQVLDINPDNVSARMKLIEYSLIEMNYDETIKLCENGIEYNPDKMTFYYFLGMCYYQKDRVDDALRAYRGGIGQINKESDAFMVSDIYARIGDILQQKNMEKDAFAAYDSCLQWKEDNIECLNNYAYFLSIKGGNLEKAEQMSLRTVKAQPTSSTFLDTYAWILFMQKRYKEALTYTDEAVKNDSDSSSVVFEHAGDIHAVNGDIPNALKYWRQAVRAGGNSPALFRKIKMKKYIKE
jgi:tetratricopeptide (TPR) repeat protein